MIHRGKEQKVKESDAICDKATGKLELNHEYLIIKKTGERVLIEESLEENMFRIKLSEVDEYCTIIDLRDYTSVKKICFNLDYMRNDAIKLNEDKIKIEVKVILEEGRLEKALEKYLATSIDVEIECGGAIARYIVITVKKDNNRETNEIEKEEEKDMREISLNLRSIRIIDSEY